MKVVKLNFKGMSMKRDLLFLCVSTLACFSICANAFENYEVLKDFFDPFIVTVIYNSQAFTPIRYKSEVEEVIPQKDRLGWVVKTKDSEKHLILRAIFDAARFEESD